MGEWWLIPAFFVIALVYASVGQGGASGYLAVLSFLPFRHEQMTASALMLNVLVAGIAFFNYSRAGYFSPRLVIPFLASSSPFAFLGGVLPLSSKYYFLALALVLIYTGIRLLSNLSVQSENHEFQPPSLPIALIAGGLIGFLSGTIGIGGGIFLSPLLILFHWAGQKETASASAFFILLNSIAGLLGRFGKGNIELISASLIPLVLIAFCGGVFGSFVGARYLSGKRLNAALSIVLFVAAFKLLGKVL